ncbi:4'-phosphopantetheinyl transferase superfamily protein [Parabacteroides sp. PF5-6]|uniref:4'-phosphopantetheinyl transferase family protein n=1 Tax=Parabacteroides sp. PF5-6 TaxID=1742403 RepID=UPI002406751A|nr:4'-phosphopantetheinyl transferase superfamily protein [Parabacteroides sp. PF5-6]MDF9830175.1 4'-phosphopantetheinyl transferase [Parabacteroides sp. PF5-6]
MPLLEIHTHPLRAIWQITETSDELLILLERKELYLPFLTQTTSEKRKQEWLATRLLLKALLGEELPVGYRANGAPFLPSLDLQLSISHTRGYAALVLAQHPVAGIDIEYRSDRALRLKERFLSPEELNHLDATDPLTHCLLYWSAKEVLFKVMDQSDVDFSEHLYIHPFPLQSQGTLTASETRTPQRTTYPLRYQVTPGYVWVWTEGEDSLQKINSIL